MKTPLIITVAVLGGLIVCLSKSSASQVAPAPKQPSWRFERLHSSDTRAEARHQQRANRMLGTLVVSVGCQQAGAEGEIGVQRLGDVYRHAHRRSHDQMSPTAQELCA